MAICKGWEGGWVVEWATVSKGLGGCGDWAVQEVEENEAVRMSYCKREVGWVIAERGGSNALQ